MKLYLRPFLIALALVVPIVAIIATLYFSAHPKDLSATRATLTHSLRDETSGFTPQGKIIANTINKRMEEQERLYKEQQEQQNSGK